MTYKEINSMIESAGVPCAYYQFKKGTAQPPPFICFYFDGSDDLYADDTNYQRMRPLTIELYTDTKDFALEETIETMLNENDLAYSRYETPIESEQLYMVVFLTQVIITEE